MLERLYAEDKDNLAIECYLGMNFHKVNRREESVRHLKNVIRALIEKGGKKSSFNEYFYRKAKDTLVLIWDNFGWDALGKWKEENASINDVSLDLD